MNRRSGRGSGLIALAATAVFACCCGLLLAGRPEGPFRVDQLRADLDAGVPNGSTYEQADVWFASRGLRVSPVVDRPTGKEPGLWVWPIPNSSLLESAEIRIEVSFGPDGRVQGRNVYRFIYSF